MNQKHSNFTESMDDDLINDNKKIKPHAIPNKKKENIIKKLIDKYHVSEIEAEKILSVLEKKHSNEFREGNKIHKLDSKSNNSNIAVFPESNFDSKKQVGEPTVNSFLDSNDKVKSTPSEHDGPRDVDEIISDIIPNYNEHISVELKNVNLTFEIFTERIDSLKEEFIRSFKVDKVKKTKLKVLNDITFKIYSGEKVGIIGYNGSGKSTLLKVISGIYPADSGSVKINGSVSPLLSLGAGFDYNYSGRRNIFLNGAVLGYDKKFLESKVDEIIEFSELGHFIDIPLKNYSSGMIAKLAFSIATILEPNILIIDEILAVGDVNFKKKSTDKIKSLMGGDTTVLFVSHSIPQVREICDKAIWIDKGKIKEIGEVNEVCDSYLEDAEKASNEEVANIQFR